MAGLNDLSSSKRFRRMLHRGREHLGQCLPTKICQRCGRTLESAFFCKDSKKPDGLNTWCRDCVSDYKKGYYAENSEYLKEKSAKTRESLDKEALRLYKSAWAKSRRLTIDAQVKVQGSLPVTGELARNYLSLLTIAEDPEVKDGVLLVRCTYCGTAYAPTTTEVRSRLNVLSGKGTGESRLYCSDGCKRACPIYNQKKFPKGYTPSTSREVQAELRKMVLARDKYTCQKCGAGQEKELHCHHMDPVANNPIESADTDICITYCVDCHKEAHQIPGCRLGELKCSSSN